MEQYGQYTVKPASELMMLGVGQPSPDILKEANKFILSPIENENILQYGMKQGFSSYRKLVKKHYILLDPPFLYIYDKWCIACSFYVM